MLLFYDHLIDKREILMIIESLPAPDDKKSKFKTMVDDILHTGILEFILQKLHPHKHQTFLSHLEKAPYDPEILSYLKEHVSFDIENQLKTESNRILKLLSKDFS